MVKLVVNLMFIYKGIIGSLRLKIFMTRSSSRLREKNNGGGLTFFLKEKNFEKCMSTCTLFNSTCQLNCDLGLSSSMFY